MSAARLVWLVTRRELREGVRGRRFLISTVVLLLLLGGIVGAAALFGGKNAVEVGIGGAAPERLIRALDAAAAPLDLRLGLHPYADEAAAREAVAHRKVDVAFAANGRRLIVRPDSSGTAVAVATSAARSAFLPDQARAAGITPAQARAVLASPLAVARVAPAGGASEEERGFAFASTVVLFIAVSVYGQAVLMSVVQEKASRIVEVLLATLRPRHLLAGKVAGVGLLGLFQVVLVVAAALAAGLAGLIELPSLGRTLPLAVVWFLLGFALYAVAFAAAGALVSRVEDASSVATPVTLVMVACYIASLGAIPNPDGGLATVLTLLPFSAPFIVAARAAVTAIPLWEYTASFLLMVAAVWALVRAAGAIYELGLLRTGPPVPVREAVAAVRARAAATRPSGRNGRDRPPASRSRRPHGLPRARRRGPRPGGRAPR